MLKIVNFKITESTTDRNSCSKYTCWLDDLSDQIASQRSYRLIVIVYRLVDQGTILVQLQQTQHLTRNAYMVVSFMFTKKTLAQSYRNLTLLVVPIKLWYLYPTQLFGFLECFPPFSLEQRVIVLGENQESKTL